MFLQIGSSFLLDQVSVFFYFFVFLILGKLLNLADEIVVAFTKSVCEPVEGNLICTGLLAGVAIRHAWNVEDEPSGPYADW